MQIFRLELTAEECAIIAGTLSNHPYRQVAPLIHKIERQVRDQEGAAAKNETAGLPKDDLIAAAEAALDGTEA